MVVRARPFRLEFTPNEVTGAIGDSITVLPLVVVAVTLGSSVRQSEHLPPSIGIGFLALATNIGLAFVVGIVVHLAYRRISSER
ncbi:hypothetical protein ACFQO4_11445 [Saliphagus sp. GCM10025334]